MEIKGNIHVDRVPKITVLGFMSVADYVLVHIISALI